MRAPFSLILFLQIAHLEGFCSLYEPRLTAAISGQSSRVSRGIGLADQNTAVAEPRSNLRVPSGICVLRSGLRPIPVHICSLLRFVFRSGFYVHPPLQTPPISQSVILSLDLRSEIPRHRLYGSDEGGSCGTYPANHHMSGRCISTMCRALWANRIPHSVPASTLTKIKA